MDPQEFILALPFLKDEIIAETHFIDVLTDRFSWGEAKFIEEVEDGLIRLGKFEIIFRIDPPEKYKLKVWRGLKQPISVDEIGHIELTPID